MSSLTLPLVTALYQQGAALNASISFQTEVSLLRLGLCSYQKQFAKWLVNGRTICFRSICLPCNWFLYNISGSHGCVLKISGLPQLLSKHANLSSSRTSPSSVTWLKLAQVWTFGKSVRCAGPYLLALNCFDTSLKGQYWHCQ